MKVVIVYASRYGNGKKCVDTVDAELRKKGHEVQVLNAPASDPAQVPPAELYIFSGATEAFGLAGGIKKYIKKMPDLAGKRYAVINTHASSKARGLPKMVKILDGKKMAKVGEIDFRVGEGSDKGNGLPPDYQARLASWVNGFA